MVLVFREYILIIHLPKDCATHFTIDWEQNMKTYRNPIMEKNETCLDGKFLCSQNDQTLMFLHRLLHVYGINISRLSFIEHLMNLKMDSTMILFNISHKILHFQIIRNFVVTYHWLFRNINKILDFIYIEINNL